MLLLWTTHFSYQITTIHRLKIHILTIFYGVSKSKFATSQTSLQPPSFIKLKQVVSLVLLAVVQSWRTHACSKHKKWRVFRHTCFCAVNEQKRELNLSACDCKVNHLNLFYILCNGNVKFHKENSSVFNHFISKFGGWI